MLNSVYGFLRILMLFKIPPALRAQGTKTIDLLWYQKKKLKLLTHWQGSSPYYAIHVIVVDAGWKKFETNSLECFRLFIAKWERNQRQTNDPVTLSAQKLARRNDDECAVPGERRCQQRKCFCCHEKFDMVQWVSCFPSHIISVFIWAKILGDMWTDTIRCDMRIQCFGEVEWR